MNVLSGMKEILFVLSAYDKVIGGGGGDIGNGGPPGRLNLFSEEKERTKDCLYDPS